MEDVEWLLISGLI